MGGEEKFALPPDPDIQMATARNCLSGELPPEGDGS